MSAYANDWRVWPHEGWTGANVTDEASWNGTVTMAGGVTQAVGTDGVAHASASGLPSLDEAIALLIGDPA